eukprot:870436-Prymnesium_polylepis.4
MSAQSPIHASRCRSSWIWSATEPHRACSKVPSYRKPRRSPTTHASSRSRSAEKPARRSCRLERTTKTRSWRQKPAVERPPLRCSRRSSRLSAALPRS